MSKSDSDLDTHYSDDAPDCYQLAASSVHYTTNCNTQSSAPEDGQNYLPKHVELNVIINKPLLLHLVGCLYYCISDARSYKHQIYNRRTGERNSLISEIPLIL